MIKVINESYDWLLNIKNLKQDYIYKYIDQYIEELFNIKIDLTESNTEFDLDSATIFGSIRDVLDSGDNYKVVKVVDDTDVLFNKEYRSIDCKYAHELSLIGDLENYDYILSIQVLNNDFDNYISDQDLINLYNNDDELLLSLLRDKKGSVVNVEI